MPNTPGAHPRFDDRGAVRWYTSLAAGLPAARSERKKEFIDSAGQFEGRVAPWSRAPFLKGGDRKFIRTCGALVFGIRVLRTSVRVPERDNEASARSAVLPLEAAQ